MQTLKLKLTPQNLVKFLTTGVFILTVINIFIQFAIYNFGVNDEWFLLFNMDKEVNIPTLYSCILLVMCSLLIKLIAKETKKEHPITASKWELLSWIFLFLAIDEGLQIHEAFIIPSLKPLMPAALTVIWIIPYGILVVFLAFYFLQLIMGLPKRVRNLSILSALIYISGAIGFEIIGSFLVRTSTIRLHGISYGLISTTEESLEMIGLLIFIYALMSYAFYYQKQELNINFHLKS